MECEGARVLFKLYLCALSISLIYVRVPRELDIMDADEAVNNPRGGTVKVSSESRQIVVNGTTLTHGVSHALPIPKKVMEVRSSLYLKHTSLTI